MTAKIKKILVNDFQISIDRNKDEDYISLTDMANAKDGDNRAADIIKNIDKNNIDIL